MPRFGSGSDVVAFASALPDAAIAQSCGHARPGRVDAVIHSTWCERTNTVQRAAFGPGPQPG